MVDKEEQECCENDADFFEAHATLKILPNTAMIIHFDVKQFLLEEGHLVS